MTALWIILGTILLAIVGYLAYIGARSMWFIAKYLEERDK